MSKKTYDAYDVYNGLLNWIVKVQETCRESEKDDFDYLELQEQQELYRKLLNTGVETEIHWCGNDVIYCDKSVLIAHVDNDCKIIFTSLTECERIFEQFLDSMNIKIRGNDYMYPEDLKQYLRYKIAAEFGSNKLALLDSSVLTTNGCYYLDDISLEDVRELVDGNIDNLDSAVGHQATAEIMTTLLGVDVPVNRQSQMFQHGVGQRAIVFNFYGHPQEGKILTAAEIEQIGYKFQILTRTV